MSNNKSIHRIASDLEVALNHMTYDQWCHVRDLVDKSFERQFKEVELESGDALFKRLSSALTPGWG